MMVCKIIPSSHLLRSELHEGPDGGGRRVELGHPEEGIVGGGQEVG